MLSEYATRQLIDEIEDFIIDRLLNNEMYRKGLTPDDIVTVMEGVKAFLLVQPIYAMPTQETQEFEYF